MKKNNTKIIRTLCCFIGILLIIIAAANIYISKYWLKVTVYRIIDDHISLPIHIVQITDLHNSVFGKDNGELVNKVKKQNPDLILITGDLLNVDDSNTDIAVGLITKLKEIAPVYCSFGNHEYGYKKAYGVDLKVLYEQAGAIVLDKEWVDINVKDTPLRIGGIYGYCLPEKYLETKEGMEDEVTFLHNMANTDRYCILLAHLPLCWQKYGSLDDYDIDLIFSGHTHGGQVILPCFGGVYAPDQGWFIGKNWGIFNSRDETKHLILSTGLGSNEIIPRFNNVPEIVSVVLETKR